MVSKIKEYLDKAYSAHALLIGGVLVFSAWGYLFFAETVAPSLFAEEGEYVVVLKEDGFHPDDISIKKGDTVTFISETGKPFWPASDLHPSHSIYSAFDPKTLVYPETPWSFQFDEVGEWKYHDHINPMYGGIIRVTGEDPHENVVNAYEDCSLLSGSQKIQCFDAQLEKRLKEGGMESAFEYFLTIYHADPEVPSVCHGWAHRLGEVEYDLYKEGKEVTLRPEATFCSYGYFHGFINAMVEDTQTVESALAFCNEAVAENGAELSGMRNNCIHGIGHSVSTLLLEDPANWGSIEKITNTGFATCDDLYAEGIDLSICYDGMFHELHLSILNDQYGFNSREYIDSGDMFYYCNDLDDRYKGSCYYDFITLWPYFFDTDKKAAMEYVLSAMHSPEHNGVRPFHTFGRSFIEKDIATGEYQESAEACKLAPDYLFGECVGGLAAGFVEHGEPEKMHIEGIAFCREDYWDASQKEECMKRLVSLLAFRYTEEKMEEVCDSLTKEEQESACIL